MNTKGSLTILAILLLAHVSMSAGVEQFEDKVQRIRDGLTKRQQDLLYEANNLDVELRAHGVQSPSIPAATNVLKKMLSDSAAWRDLASRSTRTHEYCKQRLGAYIQQASTILEDPRRQLTLIKNAEYEAWARAHPEAARINELQKRTIAAQAAAEDAQQQARDASDSANLANEEATKARTEAKEAVERAKRAQQDADDDDYYYSQHYGR